jgi:SAM-dependent methyltransferase
MKAAVCAVCGSDELSLHLKVAGEAGPQGLIPSTDRFGTALADIVRCRSCGHMQLARFPDETNLADAYAEAESGDYVEEEQGQRATARIALDAIERHTHAGRVLDLGCWVGFLLDEARARGWETVGVEPSQFASAFARDHLGLDVRTADLWSGELEPGSFDAIVLGDVLEHLPEPGQALERIRALSRPRGVLYLALPDAGSRVARIMRGRWWSVIPTHVHYFTRSSLARLLNANGWQVLEQRTAPKAFTVRYYLGRTGGYSPALSRTLVGAAALAGIADRVWAPDFRDRMAVVSRVSPS